MPKSASQQVPKTKTVAYDIAEQLRTPDEMAAYLDPWFAEAPEYLGGIARAPGGIARAKGMSQVAKAAGMMSHRQLGNRRAHPRRIDGNEAVHLSVQANPFEDVGPIRLERAAVVAQIHSRGPRDDSIGDLTDQRAPDRGILAMLSPP